jgi:hypothetical protein
MKYFFPNPHAGRRAGPEGAEEGGEAEEGEGGGWGGPPEAEPEPELTQRERTRALGRPIQKCL